VWIARPEGPRYERTLAVDGRLEGLRYERPPLICDAR